jgi:hypothetical protein
VATGRRMKGVERLITTCFEFLATEVLSRGASMQKPHNVTKCCHTPAAIS